MSDAANVAGDNQDSGAAAATADASIGADGGANAGNPAAETAKTETVAIDYSDFKLPDGVTVDADVMSEFKELAKAGKLDQETAQKFIDFDAKRTAKQAEAMRAAVSKQVNDWAEAAKVDKEFGGEKFAENVAVAKKGLDAVGNDKLKSLLKESGIGSHPEVIRAFIKIGKLVSEDKTIPGHTAPESKDLATRLYGPSTN